MQRVARMLTFISRIAMAQKMATTNPLDQLLSSDVDESVISALVGSLESQLASPTSKDSPQQNSSTSMNNNHIDGAGVGNAITTQSQADNHAGQKPGLIANNSQITISAANGSKDSISQAQLLALNSVAGISIASTNCTQGVTLLSSVNSHSSTPVTATTSVIGGGTGTTHSIPNVKFTTVTNSAIKHEANAISGLTKQVIVTVGSTNQGTVFASQPNSITTAQGGVPITSTNSTANSSGGIAGTAIYDLASIAAEQQPLQVPTTTQGKGLRPGQLTVREQLEKQKDVKPPLPTQQGNVSVNVVNAVQGTNQFTIKQEGNKVKQELKILSQPVSTQGQTRPLNIVTSKSTPNSSGVITLTKQMPNQQTMTVVRPQSAQQGLPPGTQTIQIVNASRMAGTSTTQQKTLAPRMVGGPVRIVSQPQVRAQGNVGEYTSSKSSYDSGEAGTVTLPPGLQLPPGTVLVQNEQGQLVFLTGQQAGGIQQQTATSTIPGTAQYKLQVKQGTTVSQGQATSGNIQSVVIGGNTVRPQTAITATRPQITTQQQHTPMRYPGSPHDPSLSRPHGPTQMTSFRPTSAATRLQAPITTTQQVRRMGHPPPQSPPPMRYSHHGGPSPRHPSYPGSPGVNGGEGGFGHYGNSGGPRPNPPYPVHHHGAPLRLDPRGPPHPRGLEPRHRPYMAGGRPLHHPPTLPPPPLLHSPQMGIRQESVDEAQMGVGPPHPGIGGSPHRVAMASTQVTSVRQTAPVMAARLQSPVNRSTPPVAANPPQQVMTVPTTTTAMLGNVQTVMTSQATTAGQQVFTTPGVQNVLQAPVQSLPKGGGVNLAALSTSQQQVNIIENVKKCKNFLSTLIKLASSQPADTVKNVKNLIQGLIDGKIQPEDFTGKLQVELKSSPQPCLVPFLKKSLPMLRHSMAQNKMQIEGVRAPPPEVLQANAAALAAAGLRPTVTLQPRPTRPQTPGGQTIRPGSVVYRPQVTNKATNQTKALLSKPQVLPTTVTAIQAQAGKSPVQSPQHREKRKYEALKDDDDINDVATMGGVNLSEESRNILATNSELMSGQLRSCQDVSFLSTQPLLARINERAKKLGLEDTPPEVAQLVSHATQELLRNMCAKLANIAEHRLEIYKGDSKHELKNDVKAQLKFLEELDKLEKKRHEEAEREILLRAAKSRSKHEDPEQLKLKEKAKALQQAEMEEVRQREANLTALAAIGPRKKKKPNEDAQAGSSDAGASGSSSATGSSNRTSILRPRIKRVNLRDLIFLMEQERESTKSNLLYRTYLK